VKNTATFCETKAKKTRHKGILTTLKAYIDHNKLGELLLLGGHIRPCQLTAALNEHKETHTPLGQVLIQHNLLSKWNLFLILARQKALRTIAGLVLCFMTLSFYSTKLRAEQIEDIPAKISVSMNAKEMGNIGQIHSYPDLFGSEETQSKNLKAFTKWSNMFKRFDQELKTSKGAKTIKSLNAQLSGYKNLSLPEMAKKVNAIMNSKKYIVDKKNWNKSDYWATPVEFIARGGDCEDFAIAKYVALKALGVSESRLRLAIVHDERKNIPHAILIVYTNDGTLILDNQIKTVRSAKSINHYKPIFSINKDAWWLHSQPKPTILASAN